MKRWVSIRCVFILVVSFFCRVPADASGAAGASLAPLGINLSSVCYWGRELPFVDVFKNSQPWQSQSQGQPYGEGGELLLTSKGWIRMLKPGQWADSLVCQASGHYPGGEYVCLYNGTGEIDFGFDAQIVHRERGRVLLNVEPSAAGIVVKIMETDPQDPIRDIRLMRTACEDIYERHPFRPEFLKPWKPFRVIRFMDWMQTNNSSIETWADRPVADMQTQGGPKGVALEYMIQLANRLQADPWFCMPHEATDDYVRNFAEMVKRDLSPSLRVYVEYSNEVWNGQFEQSRYCTTLGKGMGLSEDPFQACLFFYAKRSVEIFEIWEKLFPPDRLVRVTSAQNANPWTSGQILGFANTAKHVDALAVAPYFGDALGCPERQGEAAQMSVSEILDECEKDIDGVVDLVARHSQEAARRGIDLIAYEGGQHLVGFGGAENNKALTERFIEANRDSRMRNLYRKLLRGWKNAGGGLFMLFASTSRYDKWGSWGLLEYMDQDQETAPKYPAVVRMSEGSHRVGARY